MLLIEMPGATQQLWNHALHLSTLPKGSLSGLREADVTANIRGKTASGSATPSTDSVGSARDPGCDCATRL
jgi:hypothetical protein